VFDHLGRITSVQHPTHGAYHFILRMLKEGRAWMKLSGAYLNSTLSLQNYSDLAQIAISYVESAPNQIVWGSDWPHPTEKFPKLKPNDSELINLRKRMGA
jgi:predicted TIM-barrel fold metal-dependent hydrolase